MPREAGSISAETQSTVEYVIGEFTTELAAFFRSSRSSSSHGVASMFVTQLIVPRDVPGLPQGVLHVHLPWLTHSLNLLREWLHNLSLDPATSSKRAVMSLIISLLINAVPPILQSVGLRLDDHLVETISLGMIVSAVSNAASVVSSIFTSQTVLVRGAGQDAFKDAVVRVCQAWLMSFVPFAVELAMAIDHPCAMTGPHDVEAKLLLIAKCFEHEQRHPSSGLVALVPEQWYRQYQTYAQAKGVTNVPLSPIDFSEIFLPGSSDGVFEIRQRHAWRALPLEIVEAWMLWFGGGPKIFLNRSDVPPVARDSPQLSLSISGAGTSSSSSLAGGGNHSTDADEPKVAVRVRFQFADGRTDSCALTVPASTSLWDAALEAAIARVHEALLPVAYNTIAIVSDVEVAAADAPHIPVSRLVALRQRGSHRSSETSSSSSSSSTGSAAGEMTVVIKCHGNSGGSAGERRAHVGIKNLGHTCYIGSVLQALQSLAELRDAIVFSTLLKSAVLRSRGGGGGGPSSNSSRSNGGSIGGAKPSMALAVAQCLMLITQQQQQQVAPPGGKVTIVPVIDPTGVRLAAASMDDKYATDEEQDAAEFWSFVVTHIHDELDTVTSKKYRERVDADVLRDPVELGQLFWSDFRANNSSPITHYLSGQMCTTLQCQVCHGQSSLFDESKVHPVPLPRDTAVNCAVSHCLRDAWSPATLAGDERWMCPFCKKKVEAMIMPSLEVYPRFFVVQLMRFEKKRGPPAAAAAATIPTVVTSKVDTPVSLEETLLMHRFGGKFYYELVAVVLHVGSLVEGHYTCVTKYPDGGWFLHNDSTVTRLAGLPEKAREPYLLFYRKRKIESSADAHGQQPIKAAPAVATTAPVEAISQRPAAAAVVHNARQQQHVQQFHDDEDMQVLDVTPVPVHRAPAAGPLPMAKRIVFMFIENLSTTLADSFASNNSMPLALGAAGVFELSWLCGAVRLLWALCQQGGSVAPLPSSLAKRDFASFVSASLVDGAASLLQKTLAGASSSGGSAGEANVAIRHILDVVVVPEAQRRDAMLAVNEREATLCLQLWHLLCGWVISWLLSFAPFAAVFSPQQSSGSVSRTVRWSTVPFFQRSPLPSSPSGAVGFVTAIAVRRVLQSPDSTHWAIISRAWVDEFRRSKFVHDGLFAFRTSPITTHRLVSIHHAQDSSSKMLFAVDEKLVIAIPESLFDVLWMMCGGGPKIRLASSHSAVPCVNCHDWVEELQPRAAAAAPLHGHHMGSPSRTAAVDRLYR